MHACLVKPYFDIISLLRIFNDFSAVLTLCNVDSRVTWAAAHDQPTTAVARPDVGMHLVILTYLMKSRR